MKTPLKTIVSAFCLAALLTVAAPTPAAAGDASRDDSQAGLMLEKLGRGVVNLLTGFVEVPKNMAREWRRTDPFTGLTVGLFKGVGWGWARTMTGAYEIVTFPFPVPEGYVPLMDPEFVLTDIWGDPIPELNEFPEAGESSRIPY